MRYSQNPNLGLTTVTSVRGNTEYRKDCRKIKEKYYVKDEDVFYIDDTWYRLEGGKITFDNETKQMVITERTRLTEGIIGFENGKVIMGHFSPNKYTNTSLDGVPVMDYKTLPSNVIFFKGGFKKSSNPQPIENSTDYRRMGYNIEDNMGEFQNSIHTYNSFSPKIDADIMALSKQFGETTFGVEFEAIAGSLPDYVRNQCGIVICRDGSLVNPNDGTNGPEYVTIPLKGAKGMQSLRNFTNEAKKYNRIDVNCALHIHLGNLRKDRTFLVALYKLGVQIQNDMFKMFPLYKVDEVKYAGKQKNYCKKLKNFLPDYEGNSKEEYDKYINDSYKTLFSFMLNGQAVPNFSINRTSRQHPEREKWRRVARYHWINFMNMFFSDRNTIEFRLHTPTFNDQKVINWLMIVNAIVKYAENHTEEILRGDKVKIKDVFNSYKSPELGAYLFDYYKSRAASFKKDAESGDVTGQNEFTKDSAFTYPKFIK